MPANDKDVLIIAELITENPDVFNEMAVSTGAIAIGMAPLEKMPTKKKKKKKESENKHVNLVTGEPLDKHDKILYSDVDSPSKKKGKK